VARQAGWQDEALSLARDLTASPDTTTDEWISRAALAAAAGQEAEVKSALASAAAASGADAAAVAQARKDYLVTFETARTQARTRRRSLVFISVAVLLIVATLATVLAVNRAQQQLQAHADATATAGQVEYDASETAAVPTSTAEANATYAAVPLTVYSAQIPGPCGSDPASWNDLPDIATVTCSAAGAMVNDTAFSIPVGMYFYVPGSYIAYSYTVDVDISHLSPQSCAGVVESTARPGLVGEYTFFVCDDGSWEVDSEIPGLGSTLLSGQVAVSATYHLKVVVGHNMEGLSINGSPMRTAADPAYDSTASIELDVAPSGSASAGTSAASATFSNFVYTPLPFTPIH
jgi:hypothetical protein